MEKTAVFEKNGNHITIHLQGRIDSTNAAETEAIILDAGKGCTTAEIDCTNLIYISSAGLRGLLKFRKAIPDISVTNTSDNIYNILDLTGFTEMMHVRRAFRKISVAGCEVIGSGANGTVYRYDEDTIVKVFHNPDALPDIERERDLARTAFVLGIPTAISYDIVQVDNGLYGSVFEMLNADSYHHLLVNGKKTVDEIADMSSDLLKTVHNTTPKPNAFPSKKAVAMRQAEYAAEFLTEEDYQKMLRLMDTIPDNPHMLHGDFHIKNVMIQNDESLLIDMDTLCTGDPIFEISGMYVSYICFSKLDPGNPEQFFGLKEDVLRDLFHKTLTKYCEGTGQDPVLLEKKAAMISAVRMLYYCGFGKHIKPELRDRAVQLFSEDIHTLMYELDDLSSHIEY